MKIYLSDHFIKTNFIWIWVNTKDFANHLREKLSSSWTVQRARTQYWNWKCWSLHYKMSWYVQGFYLKIHIEKECQWQSARHHCLKWWSVINLLLKNMYKLLGYSMKKLSFTNWVLLISAEYLKSLLSVFLSNMLKSTIYYNILLLITIRRWMLDIDPIDICFSEYLKIYLSPCNHVYHQIRNIHSGRWYQSIDAANS